MKGFYKVPAAYNETVLTYAPGSREKTELSEALREARSKVIDIPMYIGGKEVRSGKKISIAPPHDIHHKIEAALAAKEGWENMAWEQRASIFLKAADLLAGPYRARMNAATMLGQSKNCYQAEIDSACELIDFLRFNVQFMAQIYSDQPISAKGIWNRIEYRPLEGFVFALTPFNFTAIAGNLPSCMAMMGNVVVWKPANTQVYSANVIMELFREAGLPDGVINLVYAPGPVMGDVILNHRDFAGIHFTGSTGVFQDIWKTIGGNIEKYKSYPRIVGETGGKDFIMVHETANVNVVATAIIRGAFEYQGQKCSAASRVYIPQGMWPELKQLLINTLKTVRMGPVEDFRNFINAVIDEKSFNKLAKYIDAAAKDKDAEIICGGGYDKSKGYFIEPTIILAKKPMYVTMCEELFGPVLTVYVYDENKFEETLELVDNTSIYALTGSIISGDREAIELATRKLRNAAGNFYINDKPTGAVVGQQPFGGGRASGTNDKAGAMTNLLRWVSLRTIKETMVPPVSYEYDFMKEE
jgi:1-pyrroline-5-carboxylate dehydrogenase